MAIEQVLKQEVKQIKSTLKNGIKRSKISLASLDDKKYQIAQINYFKDKIKNTHLIFPYGMAANPPEGEETLMLNIMGQEENTAAIPYASTVRFKGLQKKEVRIGNPFSNASVLFRNDGVTAINGSEYEGLIKIDDLTTKLNNLITEHNSHTHSGVQTGAGVSGTPVTPATSFSKSDYENTNVLHGERGTGTTGGSSGGGGCGTLDHAALINLDYVSSGHTGFEKSLTFGTGLSRVGDTITVNDSEINHDNLLNFVSGEHFLQTAITNVSTALSTGLLKVTTGTGALSVITDNSSNWNTAYSWGDHSTEGYLKNIVEDATPQLGGDLDPNGKKLLGDLDFNYYEAIRMVCDNDIISNIPNTGNEVNGQWFYATDAKILFFYEAGWKPIISFGDFNMYVDGTNGTDADGKGFASGSGAFKTIGYCLDKIPNIIGGNISIYLSADTFDESITWGYKILTGAYKINVYGTPSNYYSGSAISSYTAGSVSNYGTITVSGASWTTNEFVGKILYVSDIDKYSMIESNTADTITLSGFFITGQNPVGKTFKVRDFTTQSHTILDNTSGTAYAWSQTSQSGVNIYDIEIKGGLRALNDRAILYGCRGLVLRNSGNFANGAFFGELSFNGCLIEDDGSAPLEPKFLMQGSCNTRDTWLICSRVGASAIRGMNLISGQTVTLYSTKIKGCRYGAYISQSLFTAFGNKIIWDTCYYGVYAVDQSSTRGINGNTYTGCTVNIYWVDDKPEYNVKLDVVQFNPLSSAPSSPSKGWVYMDDTTNKLRVYNGTGWDNLN